MSDTEGYIDPTQPDPQFPDRPTHQDFIDLSNVVQGHDARSATAGPFEIAGVDSDSFIYMVEQRLGIYSQLSPGRINPKDPILLALYLDAFALGKAFAEHRNRKDS